MSGGQVDGVAVDEGVAVAVSGVAVTMTISGSEGAQPIATTAMTSSTRKRDPSEHIASEYSRFLRSV